MHFVHLARDQVVPVGDHLEGIGPEVAHDRAVGADVEHRVHIAVDVVGIFGGRIEIELQGAQQRIATHHPVGDLHTVEIARIAHAVAQRPGLLPKGCQPRIHARIAARLVVARQPVIC